MRILSLVTPCSGSRSPPLSAVFWAMHGGASHAGSFTSPVEVSQLSLHLYLSSVPAALASLYEGHGDFVAAGAAVLVDDAFLSSPLVPTRIAITIPITAITAM